MNGFPDLKAAPEWSLTLGEFGKVLILLAMVFYVVAAVTYLFSKKGLGPKIANIAFLSGSIAFVGTAVCLLILFVKEQWHFKYVFEHSARNHELQYKIAGVWSGQEGSFLLWGLMASIVGVIAVRGAGQYRRWFTVVYSIFLSAIAGILNYESPFVLKETLGEMSLIADGRLMMLPDGLGLAPSLLNYWVVIHPPTIFLGFGSLTVLFAYGMSALMHRNVVDWIPAVRPWALFTLAILGVGLCMGGFWAYETLGWGGFWMWDPVENTSFVPWCIVVVFVHGMFVQQAKKKWHFANVLFALLPFLLFCYGTYLTRSGALTETSVHSFAEMDNKALYLLIGLLLLSIAGGVAAIVINWRSIALPENPVKKKALAINREVFYIAAAWLLCAFGFVTALGMSIPFLVTSIGLDTKVVEEQQYHQWLAWLYPPLMLGMAVAPFVGWNGARLRDVLNRVLNCVAISIGLIGCILLWMKFTDFPAPEAGETIHFWGNVEAPRVTWVLILTWLSLFTATAAFWRMMEVWKKSKSSIGGLLTHFGLAVALLGLIVSRGFEREVDITLHKTANPTAYGMAFSYEGMTKDLGDHNNKIEMNVEGDKRKFVATPGLYAIPAAGGERSYVSWPYIKRYLLFDYYIAIGQPYFDPYDSSVLSRNGEPRDATVVIEGLNTAFTYEEYQKFGGDMSKGEDVILAARLTVVMPDDVYEVTPMIEIKNGEFTFMYDEVADTYRVFLRAVDPVTKDITIQVEYIDAAYPMKVFFKPLTLFVWLGIGIMGLGGLLAAATRRKEKRAADRNAT